MTGADRTSMRALPGRVRSDFPITASRAYLFSGGLAPASKAVTAAVEDWIHCWSFDPAVAWDHLFTEWEAVRERLAHLLGATPASIAIVDGTSRASNLAVALLSPRRGANVVVDATTYPSSLYPWLLPERGGIEVRRAPSGAAGLAATPADFEPLIDEGTVAVSITHVDPLSGFRHDLRPIADLAHAHGAALIVDVAQSAGVVPLGLVDDGVDLAAGTAMKWLLGPPGIGYLFVSSSLLAATGAPQVGYLGADLDPGDPSHLLLREDARRHELGLASLLGMPGFRAGLDLISDVGVPVIGTHVEGLLDRCLGGLAAFGLQAATPTDPRRRAGLLAIPAKNPADLQAFLRKRGVDVWGCEPASLIRVDPHLFNNHDDIDRFLEGIEDYLHLRGPSSIQGGAQLGRSAGGH